MSDHIDILGLIFTAVILFLSVLLWLWHRNEANDVDLTDLLMENGTWLGSFLVMSFGFVYAVIHKSLSDVYAGLYAATWAVPIVTKMWATPAKLSDKEPTP
jgi:hypothetical protein